MEEAARLRKTAEELRSSDESLDLLLCSEEREEPFPDSVLDILSKARYVSSGDKERDAFWAKVRRQVRQRDEERQLRGG